MAAGTLPGSATAAPSGGAPRPGPKTRRAQPAGPTPKGPARFHQLDINPHSVAGDDYDNNQLEGLSMQVMLSLCVPLLATHLNCLSLSAVCFTSDLAARYTYREGNVTRRGPGRQEKEDLSSITKVAGGCTPEAIKGIALQSLAPRAPYHAVMRTPDGPGIYSQAAAEARHRAETCTDAAHSLSLHL